MKISALLAKIYKPIAIALPDYTIGFNETTKGWGRYPGRPYIITSDSDLPTTSYLEQIYELAITGSPTGGTFTITVGTHTTAPLAHNISEEDFVAAIMVVAAAEGINVISSKGASMYISLYPEDDAGAAPVVTADGSGLTGGSSPQVEVTENQVFMSADPQMYPAGTIRFFYYGSYGSATGGINYKCYLPIECDGGITIIRGRWLNSLIF